MKKQPLTIGVFSPYFQGDYIGEILNFIRQICYTKGHYFRAFRTDGFASYQFKIGLDELDAAVVIRNAVNPKLIEKLQHQNVPVIAVAHDYFPLDVPVVTSDSSAGIDLAFDYLVARGHKRFTFVGAITHYDIRKRYEYFSDKLKAFDPDHDYDPLICTQDALFSGGLAGAETFVSRNDKPTGVICGAGHTALGFLKRIETLPEDSKPEVVAFDHQPLMSILSPELVHIDQNLDLLAMQTVETLEQMVAGANLLNETIFIKPTLRNGTSSEKGIPSLPKTNIPDYSISTHSNCYELVKNIVDSNLDELMIISPLFEEFMTYGCLSKLVYDRGCGQQLKVIKTFSKDSTNIITNDFPKYTSTPDQFPPIIVRKEAPRHAHDVYHFPIIKEEGMWGVLSIFGVHNTNAPFSDFFSFANFLENIALVYGLKMYTNNQEVKNPESNVRIVESNLPDTPSPTLEWDLERGQVVWNDLALDLLGFTTDLERNIYRTMDIFDRVHDDDLLRLRKELTESLTNLESMTTVAKLKNAEGHFQKFSFQGETTAFDNEHAIHYKCIISLIN